MSPIRDTNLNLSPAASDLPLIATNKMSEKTLSIEGTPIGGLALRLDVGCNHGSTKAMALNVILHGASSTPVSSGDPIIGQLPTQISISDTTETRLELIIPFVTNYRYVRAEFALTGAATDSPSWSVVEAYITENVGQAWARGSEFH